MGLSEKDLKFGFMRLSFYKPATAGSPCTHYRLVMIQRGTPEVMMWLSYQKWHQVS